MKLNTREELMSFRAGCKAALDQQKFRILVCGGTGCIASGSMKVYEKLCEVVRSRGIDVEVALKDHVDHGESTVGVKKCGCHGLCARSPLIKVEPYGVMYMKVQPDDCEEIVDRTLIGGEIIERLCYELDGQVLPKPEDIPFFKYQTRIALEHCGNIDCESIEEYIAVGGYKALEKALFEMTEDEIIAEVTDSGLRGRGGAGFPTGKKWSQVAAHKDAPVKFVVCNGDEGDPGAFMDCSIMEGDPHRMIEGMIIAAIATGSEQGYIYVRAEYPNAVSRLRKAIAACEEYGLIGDDILGSGKNFHLHINTGAGAFVCGEGSAMTASIEGERGMPRTKPPRSVDHGLFYAPTSLNNVETYANVPMIIEKGAAWYKGYGSENNSGTKAFSLAGNIKNTGLIEVPMGTPLGYIIENIGGGVKNGTFKAVQVGGPSGCCLTRDQFDVPLDFDATKKIGAIIGSGGLVVMGDDNCMVEIARFFTNFTRNESCGKCTTCRDGIPQILRILENITQGKGRVEDIEILQDLANSIKTCSLCGLGKTAMNPLLSTLRYFKDEYLAHIVDGKCPAAVCKALCHLQVNPDKCIGCTKCARECPTGAISGSLRRPHSIDLDKCIKCRVCKAGCPKNAIEEV